MGLSQWPSDLVLHFNHLKKKKKKKTTCIPACMCLSLPDGCIMPELPVNVFLITCFYWKPQFPVLPPHLWVWARLGSNQRSQSQTPATPTAQEYYYRAGTDLWQTTVMLGMTRTRLSDPCVWLVFRSNRYPSRLQTRIKWNVCAMQRNFNTIGQGVFGYSGSPFRQWWTCPQAIFPWKQTVALEYLKILDTKKPAKRSNAWHKSLRWKPACLRK